MNIRDLIEKYNKFEEAILSLVLVISLVISFIGCIFINKIFDYESILSLFLRVISPLVIFCSTLILGAYIFSKIKNKFKNKIIDYVGYGFYKIENKYYSINWDVKKEVEVDELVSLNKPIKLQESFYLVSKKSIKITKEQYDELIKVSSLKNKPILVLTKEEYSNFINLGEFISFEII